MLINLLSLLGWILSIPIALVIAFIGALVVVGNLWIAQVVYVGVLRCLPYTWERQQTIEDVSDLVLRPPWVRVHPIWKVHPLLVRWTLLIAAYLLFVP